ncbi:MAG: hypothetical protein V1492_00015 [Candidatus Micrarchaeota archaeon]
MAVQPKNDTSAKDLIDFVSQPFAQWFNYIRENYATCYIGLLKINVAKLLVQFGILLLFAIIGAVAAYGLSQLGMTGLTSGLILSVIVAVYFVIIIIVAAWLGKAVSLTSLFFVKSQLEGGPFSILETFGKIKYKVLKFLLLEFAIMVLMLLPGVLICGLIVFATGGLGALTGGAAGAMGSAFLSFILSYMLFIGYAIVVSILFSFLFQLWAYNNQLGEMPLVDSLKKSVAMVKGKLLEVAIFSLLLGLGALLLSIPAIGYGFVSRMAMEVFSLVAMKSGGFIVYLVVIVVFTLLNIVIGTILQTLVELLTAPTEYLFWKQMGKQKPK